MPLNTTPNIIQKYIEERRRCVNKRKDCNAKTFADLYVGSNY